MLLQPGFLHCQQTLEPDKTGYLVGWMHTESLAPPLRTRLDGTILTLASKPHQRPKSSHQQTEKQRPGYIKMS